MDGLITDYWKRQPSRGDREILAAFQGRKSETSLVCETDHVPSKLINFYGEPGIGKTRILTHAVSELRRRPEPVLVSYISCDSFADDDISACKDKLLKALVEATDGWLEDSVGMIDSRAADIVAQLNTLPGLTPVLLFDTTETVHERRNRTDTEPDTKKDMDHPFWTWFEQKLIVPLVNDGRVRMIFAGRVQAPWQAFPIRRILMLYSLLPLDAEQQDGSAQSLVPDILSRRSMEASSPGWIESLVTVILDLSRGHPELSQRLADWTATDGHWKDRNRQRLRKKMAKEVESFIEKKWFAFGADIKPEWRRILWWPSVLPWFDSTNLRGIWMSWSRV